MVWRIFRHTRDDLYLGILVLCLASLAIVIGVVQDIGRPDPHEVAGVVRDVDGHAVAGAFIWADPGGFQGRSGPDGAFHFPAPRGTTVLIRALPDDAAGGRVAPEPVTASSGDRGVVLTVPDGGALRLRLAPSASAPRKVWAELFDGGGASVRFGRFHDDGRLDLAGLPAGGSHTLYVRDDESGACALIAGLLPAGQEVPVHLSAPKELRGRVRMPDGASLRTVRITSPPLRLPPAKVDPAGDFVIPAVPDATYTIEATARLDGGELRGSACATPATPVDLEIYR